MLAALGYLPFPLKRTQQQTLSSWTQQQEHKTIVLRVYSSLPHRSLQVFTDTQKHNIPLNLTLFYITANFQPFNLFPPSVPDLPWKSSTHSEHAQCVCVCVCVKMGLMQEAT